MEVKTKKTREEKIIADYAHDYRNNDMDEQEMASMLQLVVDCVMCEHQCSSDCRREGCECACGEYHYSND